ncbi:MAG: hypothetical protein IIA45_05545 [Bacteroidetes bacterium]|nr:hypothetical protein [Bacteroidota bacterium]
MEELISKTQSQHRKTNYESIYRKILNEKLSVYNWLGNIDLPEGQKQFSIVEVSFKKGASKEFFINDTGSELDAGILVAVEAPAGHDIGMVTLVGRLVELQMKKKKVNPDPAGLKRVYRIAGDKDITIWEEAKALEHATMVKARIIARDLNLELKVTDVDYQGDKKKITFYFTAPSRVDFRELVKLYAREFRAKIEMRQISIRQEAARIGGLGPCGKELCCTSWMTEFKSVSNAAARHQNLDLSPDRLASHCGRLECCLNFEHAAYKEALADFPKKADKLVTEAGEARLIKTDILRRMMFYKYADKSKLYSLSTDQVKEYLEMNIKGEKPETLAIQEEVIKEEQTESMDVIGEVNINRLGNKRKKKKYYRRKKRR